MSSTIVGGFILLFFTGIVASGAGIGGGAINVAILYYVINFKYSDCVILSLCTVCGNYIAQTLLNYNKHHPLDKSRPLIYWDVVIALLPAQLGGSNIGAILLPITAPSLLIIFSAFVLLFVIIKTCSKTYKQYMIDIKHTSGTISTTLIDSSVSYNGSQECIDGKPKNEIGVIVNKLLLDEKVTNANPTSNCHTSAWITVVDETADTSKLTWPWYQLMVIAAIYSVYVIMFVMLKNVVVLCSNAYISVLVLMYLPLCMVIFYAVSDISKRQRNFPATILPQDVSFKDMTYLPPVASFCIGILCSLLGIGGGELLGPLFLVGLKIMPQVSSATTSMMSLLNSSSNVIHYLVQGDFPYKWSTVLFFIGFTAGIIGRYTAMYITRVYNRPSITMVMLCVVLISSLLINISGLSTQPPDFNFGELCA